MLFTETPLKGAFVVDLEAFEDPRGRFARWFCAREFEAHGISSRVAQCNLSVNYKAGTLRGMHFQRPPGAEQKLVRCTRGAIYDVIVDLRPDSPTFRQHFAVELSMANGRALVIPELFAHGFQTLADDTDVIYVMSEFYQPEYADGLRFDDPSLGLSWPLPVTEINDKDRCWPLLAPA